MIERGQWLDRLAAWWLADRYALVPLNIRTPETIGGFTVAPAAYYEAVPTGSRSVPPGMKLVPLDAMPELPPGARVRNPPPIPRLGPYVPEKPNGTIREVISADAERVTFTDGHRGEVTIKLRSWDDWQRANKAVLTLPGEQVREQVMARLEEQTLEQVNNA